MNKFLFVLCIPLVFAVVSNYLFPTRKLAPLKRQELEQVLKNKGAAGLPQTFRAISKQVAAPVAQEPVKLPPAQPVQRPTSKYEILTRCHQIKTDDMTSKKKCFNHLQASQNFSNEEKLTYFRDEILSADCMGAHNPELCRNYLLECLYAVTKWAPTRQEMETLINVVSSQHEDRDAIHTNLQNMYKNLLETP
jgi:hypothetical protein